MTAPYVPGPFLTRFLRKLAEARARNDARIQRNEDAQDLARLREAQRAREQRRAEKGTLPITPAQAMEALRRGPPPSAKAGYATRDPERNLERVAQFHDVFKTILRDKALPHNTDEAMQALDAIFSFDRKRLEAAPGTIIPELMISLSVVPGALQALRDVVMDVKGDDVGWYTALAAAGALPLITPAMRTMRSVEKATRIAEETLRAREGGEEILRLIHRTKADLAASDMITDPRKAGTGHYPGAERKAGKGAAGTFFTKEGGYVEHSFRGLPEYTTEVPAKYIYDLDADPEGLFKNTKTRRGMKDKVMRAGYLGWKSEDNVVEIFYPMQLSARRHMLSDADNLAAFVIDESMANKAGGTFDLGKMRRIPKEQEAYVASHTGHSLTQPIDNVDPVAVREWVDANMAKLQENPKLQIGWWDDGNGHMVYDLSEDFGTHDKMIEAMRPGGVAAGEQGGWDNLRQEFVPNPHLGGGAADDLDLSESLDALAQRIRDEGPPGMVFEPFIANTGEINLSNIEVPETARGSGAGTAAMRKLLAFADEHHIPVALDPRPGKGKKAALEQFYKRLGFQRANAKRGYNPGSSGEWYRPVPTLALAGGAGAAAAVSDKDMQDMDAASLILLAGTGGQIDPRALRIASRTGREAQALARDVEAAGGVVMESRRLRADQLRKYLTADEADLLQRKGQMKRFERAAKNLMAPEELINISLAGQGNRGGYQRTAQWFADNFGEDAPVAIGLVAAMSPRTGVAENTEMALDAFDTWVRLGRPRTAEGAAKVTRSVKGIKATFGPNVERVLTAESLDDLYSVLSGPKVQSFGPNLAGDPSRVTNDTWMAVLHNIDPKYLGSAIVEPGTTRGLAGGDYLAVNALTRAAGERFPGGAVPGREVQEMGWAGVKGLVEGTGPRVAREGVAIPGVTPLRERVHLIPDADYAREEWNIPRIAEEGILRRGLLGELRGSAVGAPAAEWPTLLPLQADPYVLQGTADRITRGLLRQYPY